jgi:hypothetical protein
VRLLRTTRQPNNSTSCTNDILVVDVLGGEEELTYRNAHSPRSKGVAVEAAWMGLGM